MHSRLFSWGAGIIACLVISFWTVVALSQDQAPSAQLEVFRKQLLATAQNQAGRAEAVALVKNVQIPGPYGDIGVRVYAPSAGAAPRPAILYIHGAGWVGGSVATHDNIARKLTNALPAVVISVDYRLAPEFPYPVPLEESYATLAWLHAQAPALGVDPTRIAVMGDSAGGNLAAALALMSRDRHGPTIRAQALINPTLNLDSFDVEFPCKADVQTTEFRNWMVFFRDHYLPTGVDRRGPYVSPLYAADLSGLPPAFIVTGELDLLCGSGETYGGRLRDAGGRSRELRLDATGHFGMIWAAAEPAADAAFAAVVTFLRAEFEQQ